MTIGNQSIVGDWEAAHSSAPIRCVLLSSRGASAFSTGLGHVLFHWGATSQKTFIALALLSFSIRPLRLSSPRTGCVRRRSSNPGYSASVAGDLYFSVSTCYAGKHQDAIVAKNSAAVVCHG